MEKKATVILIPIILLLFVSPLAVPETLPGLKEAGLRALEAIPAFLKGVWQELLGYIKMGWNEYFKPFLQNIWIKVKGFFAPLIQERKEIIEKELEKEKETLWQEIKNFVSKTVNFLWENIRSLFK